MEGESCDEQSGDRMLTRSIAIAASLLSGACALQGIAPSPAMAEEGAATCVRYDRDGVCTFWAKRNDTTGGEPGGTKKTQTVTKSASSCMWHGQKVPCSTSEGWYDAASGCYLSLQPDKPVIGPDPSTADPTILKYRCALIIIVIDGKPVTEAIFRSIFRRKGAATPAIDPRVAARAVVARMSMKPIAIGLVPRPGRTGYVNLPVWMWVADPGPETTGPLTVTKAEQGLSITATATLDRIVWDMGDGSTVTCGAGTPYVETEQVEDSPDCGYRYQATSKHVPGGRYTVTATSYWNVHWTGGGTEGDINGLDFGQSVRVPIGELRPVIVAPGN